MVTCENRKKTSATEKVYIIYILGTESYQDFGWGKPINLSSWTDPGR
jgi:hypothetical protein